MIPYPRFSLAERDRRWSAVRALMDERNIAVIVTVANTGHSLDFQANSRYLTHCGGGEGAEITCIFPVAGEVTIGATTAHERWPRVQNWVTDIREARRDYAKIAIERLRELNITTERVGITGLGRGTRSPEGTVLYHTLKRIQNAFPGATLVDASPIVEQVRRTKSEEEISFLRQSTKLIDDGFEALREHAHVGARDYEVWAAANYAMMKGGSEATVHYNWVSGPSPSRTLTRASFRQLEHGDVIINELEASWGGYRSQGVQPICVESCDPAYIDLLKIQAEIFNQLVADYLKPGVTVNELNTACNRIAAEARPASGPASDARAQLTLHGRGAGDDGPIITNTAKEPYMLRMPLEENMVLIFKPQVTTGDHKYPIAFGDTVMVTPKGGERFGTREHGMWVA
jgi:Xaa-Pro aminopeptidase